MSFLEIKNLSISFGGVKAVDDVSFAIEEGSVFAIIGPNGAGKSTIFNLLSRFYEPLSGQLHFSDNDLLELGAKDIARLGIARTFQNLELFEHASVLQNLLVGRHVHNNQSWWRQMLFTDSVVDAELEHRRKVEEVIDFLELAHYRNQMISGLPYGVRKKIELARALCIEPKLLLLDEPSSGLNLEETEEMGFWIEDIRRDLNITVVLIEHNMSLVAEVSDRVLAIVNGRVAAEGSHAFVQSHPDVVSAYLGDAK
ncbi:MAG: ABC transporter ATP-binding protein [Porticoccaceae bacterium]|nr:ABC transporter ATP-binding protein [Porticoccaceae bacterium]